MVEIGEDRLGEHPHDLAQLVGVGGVGLGQLVELLEHPVGMHERQGRQTDLDPGLRRIGGNRTLAGRGRAGMDPNALSARAKRFVGTGVELVAQLVADRRAQDLERSGGIVVAGQHDDGGDLGQISERHDGSTEVGHRRPVTVEEVAGVQDEVGLCGTGDVDDLGDRRVVVFGPGSVPDRDAEMPVGGVQDPGCCRVWWRDVDRNGRCRAHMSSNRASASASAVGDSSTSESRVA